MHTLSMLLWACLFRTLSYSRPDKALTHHSPTSSGETGRESEATLQTPPTPLHQLMVLSGVVPILNQKLLSWWAGRGHTELCFLPWPRSRGPKSHRLWWEGLFLLVGGPTSLLLHHPQGETSQRRQAPTRSGPNLRRGGISLTGKACRCDSF